MAVFQAKTFKTTSEFLAASRQDAILCYARPADFHSIAVAFDSMEHIENQIRWRMYQRHSWQGKAAGSVFSLINQRGLPELWVHRDVDDYVEWFKRFLVEVVGVNDADTALNGMDVDHLYSRARARNKSTAAFIRVVPIDRRVNRSHGYLEAVRAGDERPGKPISNADYLIFMKIMGWRAPSLRAAASLDVESFIAALKTEGAVRADEGEYDTVLLEHLLGKIRSAALLYQARRREERIFRRGNRAS